MPGPSNRLMVAATLVALPLLLGASPASTPSSDLGKSYQLLTTTFYSNVNPQRLLDGAQAALDKFAQKHGIHVVLPPMQAQSAPAQNVAEIRDAVARIEQASHITAPGVTYAAIKGMANAIHDRWTEFMTPSEYRDFNEALDPHRIAGIGVLISVDPATHFISAYYVVPGTPADRAGIRAGDLFTSVDGVSTKGITPDRATQLLRGAPGTVVHVAIERAGKPLAQSLAITRSEVQPPTVIYRMLPHDIGYIQILAFGRDTPQEFTTALDRLDGAGVRAYVLDLRNNGGGYVNSALDISSTFIKNDPLLTIEERGAHDTTIDSGGNPVPPKPMTVLVNRYTASASEITAGALRDDGVAVLVGEKTFGKGVMQTLTPFGDGSAIKITTAHYLTPNKQDINLKGIVPDFTVKEGKNDQFGDVNHDAQLQAALAILAKKIADTTH